MADNGAHYAEGSGGDVRIEYKLHGMEQLRFQLSLFALCVLWIILLHGRSESVG